jgi:hypothetical protein
MLLGDFYHLEGSTNNSVYTSTNTKYVLNYLTFYITQSVTNL